MAVSRPASGVTCISPTALAEDMLIEAAFRARDRINDAAIDVGPDRAVGRHTDVGKGILVKRQASGERRPADHQHRSGIVVSRGELAEARYERGGAALLREVGYEVQDEVALADRIKDVGRVQGVVLASAFTDCGGGRKTVSSMPSLARANWP